MGHRGNEVERGDGALQRARQLFADRLWDDAYRAFADLDARGPLATADLNRLALSAALSGRTEEMVANMERKHEAELAEGRCTEAALTAFHIAFRLFGNGEPARASGWVSRCQRIVERHGEPCAATGYLCLLEAQRALGRCAFDEALQLAGRAAALAERFGEPDLMAFTRYLQGKANLRLGRLEQGLGLLDEAMLAASSGQLSDAFTGVVYCSVIAVCQQVYALDRSREWTAALAAWCQSQPQLVTFTGACQIHRAEIYELEGAWAEAMEAVRCCAERFAGAPGTRVAGDAYYLEGEIHRLRGELESAEAAYRRASQEGREPQPGLALLRGAQGQHDAALGAIRRVLSALEDPWERARYLPAYVEIAVRADALDDARAAADELTGSAASFASDAVRATAAHARGAVAFAGGDAAAAVAPLREAFALWHGLGAPYLAARVRALLARVYDALGDPDGASLERAAARQVFERLGAALDLAALDAQAGATPGASASGQREPSTHGLSPRELEVLRLLATGKTNKAIAGELFLSEKTVDRHVSNIFVKLDVASRAAATAFAFQHGLT